jgi:hypothetical protein
MSMSTLSLVVMLTKIVVEAFWTAALSHWR